MGYIDSERFAQSQRFIIYLAMLHRLIDPLLVYHPQPAWNILKVKELLNRPRFCIFGPPSCLGMNKDTLQCLNSEGGQNMQEGASIS